MNLYEMKTNTGTNNDGALPTSLSSSTFTKTTNGFRKPGEVWQGASQPCKHRSRGETTDEEVVDVDGDRKLTKTRARRRDESRHKHDSSRERMFPFCFLSFQLPVRNPSELFQTESRWVTGGKFSVCEAVGSMYMHVEKQQQCAPKMRPNSALAL